MSSESSPRSLTGGSSISTATRKRTSSRATLSHSCTPASGRRQIRRACSSWSDLTERLTFLKLTLRRPYRSGELLVPKEKREGSPVRALAGTVWAQ
jgi:hypothetical protein